MFRRWIDRIRGRLPELRALARGPIFLLYVQRVRAAIVAMAAHFAFMWFLLEPLLRWLMPPPERPSGLLGLFSGPAKPPPHLEVLRWLDPVLWVLGWAAFCIFLERSIKPALARARARSRELESEAQAKLAKGEVVAGLTLLAQAAAVAPDEPDRERMKQTLLQVEATLGAAALRGPGGTQLAGAAAAAEATLAMPAGGRLVPAHPPAAGATAVAAAAPAQQPVAGRTMAGGRIVLERQLGSGAMGRVFAATDSLLGRRLAIKELVDGIVENAEARERFLREARVLARLSHPNIVQVFDLLAEGDRHYLCMELVEGPSLEAELERRGSLPVLEAAAIGQKIAEGLAYAHARGVVHRDLKPANVLLGADGAVKVVDFGVARLADARMTRTGMMIGTPVYMSPEQIRGEVAGERSDLYALGVVLFELVAGRPPFDGNIATLLTRHLSERAPRLPVPAGDPAAARLADLVDALLAKDPADRPESAAAVAAALGALRAAA